MGISRKRFCCLDCGVDVGKIGEYCMLKDRTWFSIHNSNKGMLCIGCIEKRLGRKLKSEDFNDCYLNNKAFGNNKSMRLIERLS